MRSLVVASVALALGALEGCSSDLGRCDEAAANELVYSKTGFVATKGQALTNDSCGNGAFCHARAAEGAARHGAPKSLDFDMLPSPSGLKRIRDAAHDSWSLVESGEMPPPGVGLRVVGDGEWLADARRGRDAARLPALGTKQGMAIFRNWLACGAPVVRDTMVPGSEQPGEGFVMAGAAPTWEEVHAQSITPYCATAGCHNAAGRAGNLSLESVCDGLTALRASGACGKAGVVPNDADGSFLIEKLEQATPSCGTAMPPTGMLASGLRDAVRAWIAAGAESRTCP